MKAKITFLLVVLLLFSPGLQAQKTKNKNKSYKVWVSNIDNSTIIKGILYEVDDESIKVIIKHSREITIDASSIETIKIRRKGKVGNGILIGALTGLATGGIIGVVSGDDPDKTVDGGWLFGTYTVEGETKGEKALKYGIPLAFVGGGAGALIASKKEKFIINGNIENYKSQLEALRKYSIAPNSLE